MAVRNHNDQGFDDFRRERKRMRAKLGPQNTVLGYENPALRQLEQVEEREVRDQQLTREVHEFFAAATKQAAGIVERVARDAQVETGERVEQEMEAFLIDALARMNTLIMTVLQQRRGPVAETQMEPKVGNIVGASLDEFRWAGTAGVGDKHIGQDPFATTVDEVRREFRAQVGQAEGETAEDAVPIEQHLVASLLEGEPFAAEVPPAEPVPAATAAPVARTAKEPPAAVAPAAVAEAETKEPKSRAHADLEHFKSALKALVRQGVMQREEARAAWQARLQSLGLAR